MVQIAEAALETAINLASCTEHKVAAVLVSLIAILPLISPFISPLLSPLKVNYL